jgi:peptide-methionine (R)-S-oxide reductase
MKMMFDSDLDREPVHVETAAQACPERSRRGCPSEQSSAAASPNIHRRVFLATSFASIAGLALWQWQKPRVLEAALPEPKDVTITLFSDSGERLKKTQIAKVIKTSAEWRKQLPPGVFDITRNADTEIAFTGKYWNLHDKGIYRCVCCDNALFDSATKFESGTGWPSFWAPIAAENVAEIRDSTFGIVRTAVACTECDAHLGHVFDDGPQPTGLRYCMNSASLRFVRST